MDCFKATQVVDTKVPRQFINQAHQPVVHVKAYGAVDMKTGAILYTHAGGQDVNT